MRTGLVAAALFAASAVTTVAAQFCERDVLLGPDYGHDVALERRLMALGAPGANTAHVYQLVAGGWQLEPPLVGALPGEFGFDVDIDVATLAVGAPGEAGQVGAVYMHRRIDGVWVQTQRLLSSDAVVNRFGGAVAVQGDLLVVGAPADADVSSFSGAAYVFERTGPGAPWLETQKLTAQDASILDAFGAAVDVDDEVIVVGAPRADTAGVNAGAVYVFERQAGRFVQTARVQDASPQTADLFGRSVSFDAGVPTTAADDVVWIGAPLDDDAAPDAGSVSVVRRVAGDWVVTQKILLDDATALDRFGTSVAVRGGDAVGGAPGRGAGLGAARVFTDEGAGFVPRDTLTGSFGASTLGFGQSVTLSKGHVVVGAETLVAPTSAVYVYAGLDPWLDLGESLAGPLGAPALALDGTLCPGSPLTFQLDDALPSALAALVIGFFPLSAPFKGGVLVPNPDATLGFGTDPLGGIELATTWPRDFPVGLDLLMQVWVLDPGGPLGYTASNAVSALTP